MNRKRTVILFGAGAVIDWGGPKTPDITALIRNNGFWTKDGKTRITEFIYQKLLESGFSDDEVNFETILNVLEELISYYANQAGSKKLPSYIASFFTSTFEKDLLNFEEENFSHSFKIHIPGLNKDFSPLAKHGENANQLFLQELVQTLLTTIYNFIEKYGDHRLNESNVICEDKKELNKLFCDWIEKINQNGILRMFSLNYERNFKVILEKGISGMNIFEGFEAAADINYEDRIPPNATRILTDFETHCHYNLHGSVYWDIESENENGFMAPRYFLTGYGNLTINNDYPIVQSEKGKTILISNFIAGYQKLQKSAITPFRQMKYAFDRDCITADIIYIIGYSYGDEHINSAIGEAIRNNQKVKLIFVDPSFQKNDTKIIIASLGHYSQGITSLPRTIRTGLEHEFNSGIIKAYTMTFKDFLVDQTEPPHLKYLRILAK
ncbi:hypothetical protein [Algoriphagus machipongonensis]|uniref:SIR2-like domain-containing protein n=1 Tax=Algoriphagus machipongonensis TaxID=388413 RepID=A3I2A7_9BACT|nr:hypothetical protein [Algoriphagus machipongonensis]EAZ79511.1 hypothetical protein ALPR1_04693 [Algoriphagus machipongonensis]